MGSLETAVSARPVHRHGDPVAPVFEAFLDACRASGVPTCDDANAPDAEGILAAPYAIAAGQRRSASVAFLDPARSRPNLEIRSGATVEAVVLEHGRARGVRYRTGDRIGMASSEAIVLSAGAYGSPAILLRSRVDIPGVGAGLQDHAVVDLWHERGPADEGSGPAPRFRLVLRSGDAAPVPDLHVSIGGASTRDGVGVRGFSVRLLEQRARGSVALDPIDPMAVPVVRSGLLADDEDVAAVVRGAERLRAILERAGPHWFGPRAVPGHGGDLADYAKRTHVTYDHGVGTCRMGPAGDAGAVVDERLRVHGAHGLWVADASVLPVIPHANPNLSVMLVGELGARSVADA
jgi:choline dehydrogenase